MIIILQLVHILFILFFITNTKILSAVGKGNFSFCIYEIFCMKQEEKKNDQYFISAVQC